MVESVKNQSYANWELLLVNASPDNQELKARVEHEVARDNRIKSITLAENKGISENTNAGVAAASGDFVSFFDHDDILEPDLLFSYAMESWHSRSLNRISISIYSEIITIYATCLPSVSPFLTL